MNRHLLYIVGYAGSGKTSLLEGALQGAGYTIARDLFQRRIYAGGVMLGGDRLVHRLNIPGEALFSGTDALQRNAQPKVIKWLQQTDVEYVVGEGDRLGNRNFFEAAAMAGWEVDVRVLRVDLKTCYERMVARGYVLNGLRYKIAVSKVNNVMGLSFVKGYYDGNLPLGGLINQLRQHPVIQAIRGGQGK